MGTPWPCTTGRPPLSPTAGYVSVTFDLRVCDEKKSKAPPNRSLDGCPPHSCAQNVNQRGIRHPPFCTHSITTMGPWQVESAITANNGSKQASPTTAGPRPKRPSRGISPKICRTPGSGCARLPSPSEISGSTPRTNRSCSRASRVTSSCVRRGTSSNSACFSAAP